MADPKQNKRARGAAESLTFLAVVSGILITLTFIAHQFNLGRIDLTEARRYSLSDGSRRVVSNLDDQLVVTAYFSPNLPHPYNTLEPYVRDLLQEYQAASGGRMQLRFVHPETDDEKEDAVSEGLQAVPHLSLEDDSFSYTEGFQGLVLTYLAERKVIPVLRQPPSRGMPSADALTSGLEYELTMAFKEVTGDRVRVGVLGGHEGPSLEAPAPQPGQPPQPGQSGGLQGLIQAMPTYDFVTVDASREIDADLAALLIIDPETTIGETELRHIDQYVMRGGALGVFAGQRSIHLDQGIDAQRIDTGLNRILDTYGAHLEDDIVAAELCSVIPLQGPFGIPMQAPYPVFPRVNTEEEAREHPIFFRLPSLIFPWASSVSLTTAPEGVSVDVLAETGERSWAITGETYDVAPRREGWQITTDRGPFKMLVAIEGTIPSAFAGVSSAEGEAIDTPERSARETRVLVTGTGVAFHDDLRGIFRPTDMAVYLNALDWLAADSDLIAVRAKNVGEPDIAVPQDVQQADEARLEAAAAAQQAQLTGDVAAGEEAVDDYEAAQEEFEQAEAEWRQRKNLMRWGTTLGIPFFFGLFGVIRWRMRQSRRQNFKL